MNERLYTASYDIVVHCKEGLSLLQGHIWLGMSLVAFGIRDTCFCMMGSAPRLEMCVFPASMLVPLYILLVQNAYFFGRRLASQSSRLSWESSMQAF